MVAAAREHPAASTGWSTRRASWPSVRWSPRDEAVEELFLTNVIGPLFLLRRVVPALEESQGFVAQISAVVAEQPLPGWRPTPPARRRSQRPRPCTPSCAAADRGVRCPPAARRDRVGLPPAGRDSAGLPRASTLMTSPAPSSTPSWPASTTSARAPSGPHVTHGPALWLLVAAAHLGFQATVDAHGLPRPPRRPARRLDPQRTRSTPRWRPSWAPSTSRSCCCSRGPRSRTRTTRAPGSRSPAAAVRRHHRRRRGASTRAARRRGGGERPAAAVASMVADRVRALGALVCLAGAVLLVA